MADDPVAAAAESQADALVEAARRALLGGVRLSLAEWNGIGAAERAAFAQAGLELRAELVALLCDPVARAREAAALDPEGAAEAEQDAEDDIRNSAVLDALERVMG